MDSAAAAELLDRVLAMLENTHSTRRTLRLLMEEAPLPTADKMWKILWKQKDIGVGLVPLVRLLLLCRQADPNAADPETGNQALHWIAAATHMADTACASIKLLLDYGANVHARNKDGKMPLSVALMYANAIVFEYLLEHGGADPNETDIHGTPVLVLAAAIGDPLCVDLLLRHGADAGKTCSDDGRTALSYAFDVVHNMNDDNNSSARRVSAASCVAMLAKPLIAELAATYDEMLAQLLSDDQSDLRRMMVSVYVGTLAREVHTNKVVAYTGVNEHKSKL